MLSWLSGGSRQRDPKAEGPPKLGSAQSRSTSAGSSSHPSLEEREGGGDGHSGSHRTDMQKVPEHEYPVPSIPEYDYPAPFPLEVKNTFLDVKAAPGSFLEFYNDRQIRSAPGSKIEEVDMGSTVNDASSLTSQTSLLKADTPSSQASTEVQGAKQGLPDIEYPVPVMNTFLHFKDQALMDCLKKREVRSCPGSKIHDQDGNEMQVGHGDEDFLMKDQLVGDVPPFPATPFASGYDMPSDEEHRRVDGLRLQEKLAAVGSMPPPPVAPPSFAAPLLDQEQPPPPGVAPSVSVEAAVISLAAALPEPILGSPELPTEGSRGHRTGTCKPCAFNHTRGCKGGVTCQFCHLCPPGEKKRRQKEKMAVLKSSQAAEASSPGLTQGLTHVGGY
mmetsp:Transcript_70050/g.130947  ORF Transcript_70050/g.130947 Transcript_70050/m.130947 type:complete len:388 (-) Transcript_70050:136-1299(-)